MLMPRSAKPLMPLFGTAWRRLRAWKDWVWAVDRARRRSRTARRRCSKRSPRMKGRARAKIVAMVATNTISTIMLVMLKPLEKSTPNCSMARRSLDFEVDHLAHHQDADAERTGADDYAPVAGIGGDQQAHIIRGGEAEDASHCERHGADDPGRRFRFARQRLDLVAHLFAVAQDVRQLGQRLGEVTAGGLLGDQHDGEEPGLVGRHPRDQSVEAILQSDAHL